MKISGSNRWSKSRSVSLVGMLRPKLVVHDFNPPLVTIAGPYSRFPHNGTHVCKGNCWRIAERNVPDLSFVYHLFKSWTDRVTNLGSLENTLGSLLTSKATPQAAENIIIIGFGVWSKQIVWSKQSHILIAIQNLDMRSTNLFIALILIFWQR